MKRLRIIHKTEYFYNQPVTFGPHQALMRPREGHDAHIARAHVHVEPKAEVRWLHDIYDNSIAILTFERASDKLSIASEVDVDTFITTTQSNGLSRRLPALSPSSIRRKSTSI
jgi:hypothetical protein